MDEGTDSWLIIPKSDFIDALVAGADKFGNLAMEIIFRLGPERPTRRKRIAYMIYPQG